MEYNINKGIGRNVEFNGLQAQYLYFFVGGLLAIFLLFVIFCGMTRIMISMTLGQSQDSATQPQTLPRVLTAAPLSALAATILLGFATWLMPAGPVSGS